MKMVSNFVHLTSTCTQIGDEMGELDFETLMPSFMKPNPFLLTLWLDSNWVRVNQHPPMHHALDICYDPAVDEPQLS